MVLGAGVDQGCRRHGCAFSAASVGVVVWSCWIKVFTSSDGRWDPADKRQNKMLTQLLDHAGTMRIDM